MWNEFLEKCAIWVIQRANERLDMLDVGIDVIEGIKASWSYTIQNGVAKIINTFDKAVYVEFGVGIVGQGNPHPFSEESGYEYNLESTAKDDDGVWRFYANDADLDLPQEAIGHGSEFYDDSRDRMLIYTQGAVGAMYAYNAMQDLKTTGTAEKFWKEIRERYL